MHCNVMKPFQLLRLTDGNVVGVTPRSNDLQAEMCTLCTISI